MISLYCVDLVLHVLIFIWKKKRKKLIWRAFYTRSETGYKKRDETIYAPPLYGDYFNQDAITRQDGMISVRPFRTRIINLFHNFLLLMEIVDKPARPNSIFKFNPSFYFLSIISYVKSKALTYSCLWENQPLRTYFAICFFLSVGNVLNILFCCRHDSWKILLEELFLVTSLVCCCEFMYRYFLICSETLGPSFFRQLWLAASLRKDC